MNAKQDATPPLWSDVIDLTPEPSRVRRPTKADIVDSRVARDLIARYPKARATRKKEAWWIIIPGSFDGGYEQWSIARDVVAELQRAGILVPNGDNSLRQPEEQE